VNGRASRAQRNVRDATCDACPWWTRTVGEVGECMNQDSLRFRWIMSGTYRSCAAIGLPVSDPLTPTSPEAIA
jgi:hypothetical protein